MVTKCLRVEWMIVRDPRSCFTLSEELVCFCGSETQTQDLEQARQLPYNEPTPTAPTVGFVFVHLFNWQGQTSNLVLK